MNFWSVPKLAQLAQNEVYQRIHEYAHIHFTTFHDVLKIYSLRSLS